MNDGWKSVRLSEIEPVTVASESVLYALGCYEALGGRPEAALAHVQRAAELNPRIATWAQTDKDLASIRALPGFPSA